MGNGTTGTSIGGYSSKEKCLASATKVIEKIRSTNNYKVGEQNTYVCVEVN